MVVPTQDPAEAPSSGSERPAGRTGGQTSDAADGSSGSSEQFSSFLFWRELPRPLDTELLELLVGFRANRSI